MSQSLSRRSFLKCAGSGAVSLAAALLTGVCAAAQQPCLAGEPALLDGKAAGITSDAAAADTRAPHVYCVNDDQWLDYLSLIHI